MFEIQYLDDTPLDVRDEEEVQSRLRDSFPEHDLIMIADFGHGMFTERIREDLCGTDKFLALNTQTNSANFGFNLVTNYRRGDYVCLHEGEIKLAAGKRHADLRLLASELRGKLNAAGLMVTRGPNGSMLVDENGSIHEMPAFSMRVVDRTGAGDAFFAVTGPCAYKGYSPDVIGLVGNCVGALAVEVVGNRAPVQPEAVKKLLSHLMA